MFKSSRTTLSFRKQNQVSATVPSGNISRDAYVLNILLAWRVEDECHVCMGNYQLIFYPGFSDKIRNANWSEHFA